MKKIVLITAIALLNFTSFSQQLSQITFSGGMSFSWFTVATNQNVLIRISDAGKPLEWGTEEQAKTNSNYYAPKLLPYMGRVDYYGAEADSINRGKVKSIGTCYITYYGAGELAYRIGKIKTMGSLSFDYYTNYDDALLAGKVKTLGSNSIAWYSSFENEFFKGKPKMIGNTSINWYSSFDDKLIKGKLKSIGSYNYLWYTSFDKKEYGGALKSGAIRQIVNGVTYILW